MRAKALSLLSLVGLLFAPLAVCQDVSDVETKPYGSYVGGKVDTVDLSNGNLLVNIPLVSYPQLGTLPALTFGLSLINAPYTQVAGCDMDYDPCIPYYDTYRYDTSPPGSYDVSSSIPGSGNGLLIGAYITSSMEGPLVKGTFASSLAPGGGSELDYEVQDPSGATHQLEPYAGLSYAGTPSGYGTVDGSGFTFVPDGPGNPADPWDPENYAFGGYGASDSQPYWKPGAANSGTRTGSVFAPNGVKYTNQLVNQAFQTTAVDPSGNTISRGVLGGGAGAKLYVDSVNRHIPDPIAQQDAFLLQYWPVRNSPPAPSSSCPHLGVPGQPTVTSMDWVTPASGGHTETFTICYTQLTYQLSFATIPGRPPYYPFNWGFPPSWGWYDPGTPDTTIQGISGGGYAIQAVVLPDHRSYWGLVYDGTTGDLAQLLYPTGASVSYTYDNVPLGNPCGYYCRAVTSRVEADGQGHSSTSTYAYGLVVPPTGNSRAYTTSESHYRDDLHGNSPTSSSPRFDILHTFTSTGDYFTPPAYGYTGPGNWYYTNQYYETQTDYYASAWSGAATPVKTVQTQYEYQYDVPTTVFQNNNSYGMYGFVSRVANVLPSKITTQTPGNTATLTRKYMSDTDSNSYLIDKITCLRGSSPTEDNCYPMTAVFPDNSVQITYTVPISITEPTWETVSDASGDLRTKTKWFQMEMSGLYAEANMLTALSQVSVWGTDNNQSLTTYIYDGDNGYSQGVRGNLTSVSRWDDTNNSASPLAKATFDAAGMVTSTITPNGTITKLDGSMALCADGRTTYLQTATSAYQSTTTTPEQATASYDCATGALQGSTDVNGVAESIDHSDPLNRVTTIKRAVGTPSESWAVLSYPSMTAASVSSDQNALHDGAVTQSVAYDGLGRPTRQVDAAGYIIDTTYNPLGQVATVSNPHVSGDTTYGSTTYSYDALGRTIKQQNQEGGTSWWCYNGTPDPVTPQPNCSARFAANGRLGSWVDFSDENGKHQQQINDALGQLIAVIEPDPLSGNLALETDYGYDGLGNLASVNQLGNGTTDVVRSRTFRYNSLSRLISSYNPETGTTCYGTTGGAVPTMQNCTPAYDADGNLLAKTTAAPNTLPGSDRIATVAYTYDALDRLIKKTASSTVPSSVSLSSCFKYDSATLGIGRLGAEWTQNGTCSAWPGLSSSVLKTARLFTAYTPLGLPVSEQQCAAAICTSASLTYGYDLLGHRTNFVDAAGASYNEAYDSSGRVTSFKRAQNVQSAGVPLFTASSYGPAGLTTATLGNGLTETSSYTKRFQLAAYAVGPASPAAPVYGFSITDPVTMGSGFDPGGNVHAVLDSVNGGWTYGYDALNRLSSATSAQAALTWTYDNFGNLMHQTPGSGTAGGGASATSINQTYNLSGARNQPDDFQFDVVGNQLSNVNPLFGNSVVNIWDSEGRLSSQDNGTTTYLYDAEGKRVAKQTGGGATVYVYDATGHAVNQMSGTSQAAGLPSEIYLGGRHLATLNGGYLYYHHADWLGTERATTDQTGTLCQTSASQPFGDNVVPTLGTCAPSPMFFTGTERDGGQALDYMGARYYASNMGRWTSPDPSGLAYADRTNPQSLNLYSYVLNNPLRNTDPSGEECVWDNGSYDAADDPDTGSADKCSKQGGTWVNPDLFENALLTNGQNANVQYGSWSGQANSTMVSSWLTSSSDTNALPDNSITLDIPLAIWNWTLTQTSIPSGLWTYGHYGGPGGSGVPVNNADAGAMVHDYCYFQGGFTADSNAGPPNAALQACNQQLCDIERSPAVTNQALDAVYNNHGATERDAATDMIFYFTHAPRKGNACKKH